MSSQEIVVFNSDFPSDATSVKFRAVQWICTEVMLALAVIWNLLPRLSQLVLPLAAPADLYHKLVTSNGYLLYPPAWSFLTLCSI
jgi:hypothetical protein